MKSPSGLKLNCLLSKYAEDTNGLQKAVGLTVCFIAMLVGGITSANFFSAKGYSLQSAIFNSYSLSIWITGILAIISALWFSKAGKLLQVSIFVGTGLLAAMTSRSGDLTSGIFMIFAMILIYQYGLGKIGVLAMTIIMLVPYPLALASSLRKISKTYIFDTALIVSGILFLFLLYAYVFLRHEIRHRQDKALLETRVKERTAELEQTMRELEAANAEEAVMLREIHHRVRNNLQVIISMLRLESEGASSVSSCLDTSIQRIYAMALVHETLYGEKSLNGLDLVRYSRDLLGSERETEAPNLHIDAPEPIPVDLDFAVAFGLFMNEVISLAAAEEEASGKRPLIRLRLESAEAIAFSLSAGESTLARAVSEELAGPDRKGFIHALVGQLRGYEQAPAKGWDLCLGFPLPGSQDSSRPS